MKKLLTVYLLMSLVLSACINTADSTGGVKYISNDSLRLDTANIKENDGLPEGGDVLIDTVSVYNEAGTLLYKRPYEFAVEDHSEQSRYSNYIKGYPENDTLYGDFNGDRSPDTAWFNGKTGDYSKCQETSEKKHCRGIINFSDKSIPALTIDFFPFGLLKNEGDLNDDGSDEIGVLLGWFTSECRSYYVYTLKGRKWKEACKPISNSLNMREAGIVLIEKDPIRKGYAIVRSSFENSPMCSCQGCRILERSVKLN